MASATITPAQLEWSGEALVVEPVRVEIEPETSTWTGGFILAGPGSGTALEVPDIGRLARIARMFPIVDGGGFATAQYQLHYQRALEAIEAAIAALTAQVNDNAALLAEIRATQEIALTANDNAVAVREQVSISESYPDPTNVLSASNTGDVIIAAHTRRYTDGTSAEIDAGSVTGFQPGDYVTVFYTDAARAGGAVEYSGTTDAKAQQGSTHVVGSVTVPQEGEPAATGITVSAPGFVFTAADISRAYQF